MDFTQERSGDCLVLKIGVKRVDSSNSVPIKECILSSVEEGERKIVLDLSMVEFMDSCGLAALLSVVTVLPDESTIVVAEVNPRVEQLFRLTRLDSVFDSYPSVDQAFSALCRKG